MLSRYSSVATSLPLLLMALLAGLSYWLDLASRPPAEKDDGRHRHDPDYIITHFATKQFDAEGRLRQTFMADELLHYPDTDLSEVRAPRLSYLGEQVVEARSQTALILGKGEHVQLIGDVRVVLSRPHGKGEDRILSTQHLDAWPDEEIAQSSHPLTLVQGRSLLEASGFHLDNKIARLELIGPVRGILFRKDLDQTPLPASR